jgi:hypothetical protein
MLSISEELRNILRNDRFPLTDTITPKDLEIIFDGMDPIYADQVVDDSFELTESIIIDDDIRFGACRASQIKFKLANVQEELKGREFTISQLIGDDHIIPLGKFKVESAKLEDDLIFKEVIAYDKLKDTDVDVSEWYNGLFPIGDETYTLKQFRSSLLAYLGVEEVDQTLPNDDMTVTKTIEPTQISGRTVLEATVELNGAFGHINRQGEFVRIVLPKLIDSTPEEITKDIYMTVKFEEYEVKPVDKLQVRSEEDDIGAIYGEGINTYVIQGNFLLYGKAAEELQTIAENVSVNIFGRAYRPYTAVSIGLPYLEVGDTVELTTEDTVVSYILQRTLTGIQALKDEFEAPGSEEREQNFGVNNEIIQLQGKFAKIKKDVDGIVQTVGDIEQGVYTEIEQLADQLVLKVDANGNVGLFALSSEEDGTQVLIKADNISLEGLTTINEGFKILLDGSFEAVAGEIAGFIVVPEDESGDGGLIYTDETGSKFVRISPYSSMDGQGGFNTEFGAIDLGLASDGKNTLIHLRSDGYARFGLVSEGGVSVRFNDFLRHQATNGEIGTDTILYSQNFQINRDGTVNIKSDDITKPLKSINVTKSSGQISKLDITFEDNSSASLNVEYNADGDITKVGDITITY